MSREARGWLYVIAGAAAAGFWSLHSDTHGPLSVALAAAAGGCFGFSQWMLIKLAREAGRRDVGGR